MFLWVTSPAPPSYGGGTHVFDSGDFFDVSNEDQNGDRTLIPHTAGGIRKFGLRAAQVGRDRLPVVIDKEGRMLSVVPQRFSKDGNPLVLNSSNDTVEVSKITLNENKQPEFFDKNGAAIKGARPIMTAEQQRSGAVARFMINGVLNFLNGFGAVAPVEEGQADGGVLLAQNGSLVYYASMFNDVLAYFLTGMKDGAISVPSNQFPTSQADLTNISTFAKAHGRTLNDSVALAIELKTSWIEASSLSNPNDYITMDGSVPTYDKTDPKHWVQNGEHTVKLALVGIHVVGSTAGHPEMIWATFEHVGNSPDATYAYINNSNQAVPVNRNTSGTWLFCATNASGPFNEIHQTNSLGSTDITAIGAFNISPSNIIHWKPWGAGFDQTPNPIDTSSSVSNTEIISMNNSIRGMLAAGDVRGNYILRGATWTTGGPPSGHFPTGNEVGTSRLANTTMETFQQGSDTLASSGSNCFSCHSTNTVSVSHLFGPTKPLF
jgi:hypothetical protein